MNSTSLDCFFSCSFRTEDKKVNDFFRAICTGLAITCENVDGGYRELPPERARAMIAAAACVVAVAVKRDPRPGADTFSFSEAVSNEISMAYTLQKPLLIVREDCVAVEGFLGSYGTHLVFARSQLGDGDLLERSIRSIHDFKLSALSPHQLELGEEVREFISEESTHLFELHHEHGDFLWEHSGQRRISFVKNYKRPLELSRWCDQDLNIEPGSKDATVTFEIKNASRRFDTTVEIEKAEPSGIKARVLIVPPPAPQDFIEYRYSFRGRYILPVYREDLLKPTPLEIDEQSHLTWEGVVPVNRIKRLVMEFRFPKEYGLELKDVATFVGSFTQEIDYLVESERKRCNVRAESTAGNLLVHLEINSPLLRHAYGVAWTPRSRVQIARAPNT